MPTSHVQDGGLLGWRFSSLQTQFFLDDSEEHIVGVIIAIQGSNVGCLTRRQRIVCFTTRITKLGAQSTARILCGYFPEAYMLSR